MSKKKTKLIIEIVNAIFSRRLARVRFVLSTSNDCEAIFHDWPALRLQTTTMTITFRYCLTRQRHFSTTENVKLSKENDFLPQITSPAAVAVAEAVDERSKRRMMRRKDSGTGQRLMTFGCYCLRCCYYDYSYRSCIPCLAGKGNRQWFRLLVERQRKR